MWAMLLDAAFWTAASLAAVMSAAYWACLAETVRLFRSPAPAPRPLLPMTLIKPVKGLDEGLAGNFEAIAAADPEGKVQVIIALESRDDEAYPVAAAFAARHPERDILVLETGSPRGRMGKAHNMIEALPRAAHPRVIFSDSDVQTTPRLLAETSRAFEDGCDAVYAVPQQRRSRGLSGVLLEIALNHYFGLAAALGWRVIPFTFCAGAWMGYTAETLRRAGGLEPFSHAIADDFALSHAVARTGARGRLIGAPVLLREAGGTPAETLEHLLKWAIIIRWSVPWVYCAMPVFNAGLQAAFALALAFALGRHRAAACALAAGVVGTRAAVAFLYDLLAGDGPLPLPWYALLGFMDVGSTGFWLNGFRRTIRWRGVTYRLSAGGRAEVLRRDGQPRAQVLS
jgi:ceramide glucosyltransferase